MGKVSMRLSYYMDNYKIITCLVLLIFACMFTGIQVHAEDTAETAVENTGFQGKLMVTSVDTEAKDKPEAEAAVILEIPKGTSLLTIGEEGSAYIESLEMQRKALKQTNIWRIVIVILIILIFIVGVVSALNKNKNNKQV